MKVNQILPTISAGDAIGNEARAIQALLRKSGHESEIYAQNIAKEMRGVARDYGEYEGDGNAVLIYHYSIGSEVTDSAVRLPDRLVLRYHNITPPDYFLGVNDDLYRLLRKGYDDLGLLEGKVELAICDSAYNAQCLRKQGAFETAVCPIVSDSTAIARAKPDRRLLERLEDGAKKFLFVGRFCPNKRQDKCIELFYYYHKANPESKLLLVGSSAGTEAYYGALGKFAKNLGIAGSVEFSQRKVTQAELAAYYKSADAFLCASEHEGFCVPLVEAMACGVPAIAARQEAVVQTLGEKSPGLYDFEKVDRKTMLKEKLGLVDKMLAHQEARLAQFGYPDKPKAAFLEQIRRLAGKRR